MTYRKLKSVDLDVFREHLAESVLCTGDFTGLDELVRFYNSTLSALMDRHAPQKRRTVIDRPRVPWFNNEIKAAIKERRRAERKWRASKSAAHLAVFKQKKNYATLLMNAASSTVTLSRIIVQTRANYSELLNLCCLKQKHCHYQLD